MKTRVLKFCAAALAAPLFLAGNARATVTSGDVTGGTADTQGGTFVKLTVPLSNPFGSPNSVGNNTFQSPNLYAFDEDQNIVIPAALTPNIGGPIAAGTEVASHYVFFDPNNTTSQRGYVDFDAIILGIFTSTTSLFATDFLANTGVNYLNPAARGLEAGDSVWIDPSNPNRVRVDWDASTPGDYIRVLTAHSPIAAPDGGATAGLLGIGVGALAFFRRGQKRK